MSKPMQHVVADSLEHAESIACGIAMRIGAVTTEVGEGCMILASGLTLRNDNLIAVITWEC